MSTGNDAIAVRWPTFSRALQANFRQLRLDNKLIDIIIAVENQQIPAHRLLLASCSKFFFELFESLITSIGNPTIRKCINNYLERARFKTKTSKLMCLIRIAVALAEVQYDEMLRIIELIYGGQVDVPKTSWAKFTAAAKVLKINGFEKVDDVNPDDIEKGFAMRNCYVRLTDVTTNMKKIAAKNKTMVTENTPPNSAPGTPFASPDAVAGTSKTLSANSEPTKENSCVADSEIDAADVLDTPILTHQPKASKRSSDCVPFVHPKKNRYRLESLNDSSDSDVSLVPSTSKPSSNQGVALCHPKKNRFRLCNTSDSDSPLILPASKTSSNVGATLFHQKKNPLRMQSVSDSRCNERSTKRINPGKLNKSK